MMLDQKLLKIQKVSEEQEKNLFKIYEEMRKLFDEAREHNNSEDTDTKQYKKYAEELEKLEFRLQENWNFEQDRNFHSYWFMLPGCNCPQADNKENFGTEYRIITLTCPYHGSEG